MILILIFLSLYNSSKMADEVNENNVKDIAYVVTQNFNAPHIEELITTFQINSVPYQLQKDHDSLGLPLDRRYFVIVDNILGATKMGPWFSSLLLFIVGYPKRGNNKKNHYCTQAIQVLVKYNQFRELPQFVLKSYLSSNIASKQFLKSSKSAISSVSNSRALSESSSQTKQKVSEIVKNNFRTDDKSKLLLFLSESDQTFNKWLLKIAANNPKKFEIVQNLQDFNLTRSVCKSKQNFVLMNLPQYQQTPKENLKGVGILIFSNGTAVSQKLENIVAICNCKNDIIVTIRDLGFQVLSLKDIDKSIVKYGNPFAKQQKPRSNKKILWEKQADQKNNNLTSAASDEYFIKVSAESCKSNKLAESAPANCYPSMSKEDSASIQFQHPKQKKRVSIQSNCKNDHGIIGILPTKDVPELQQSKSKSPMLKRLVKSQSVWNNCKKSDLQEKIAPVSATPESNPTPIKLKSPLKIKKIKDSKSINQKNKAQKQYQIVPIVAQFIAGNNLVKAEPETESSRDLHNSSVFDESATEKHVLLNSSRASLALKSNKRQSNTMSFPQSFDLDLGTNKNNNKQIQPSTKQSQSQNKQNKCKPLRILKVGQKKNRNLQRQSASLKKDRIVTYRMRILGVEQSNIIKVVDGEYHINQLASQIKHRLQCSHVLLWKDFNFQISNSRNHVVNSFEPNSITDKCFCFASQLKSLVQNCDNNTAITLFLDQVDLSKHLSIVQALWGTKKFASIYVFQTQGSYRAEFLQQIKCMSKQYTKIQSIMKPIMFDAYLDTGVEAAKEFCRWLSNQQNLSI